jgi:hypothetical protein
MLYIKALAFSYTASHTNEKMSNLFHTAGNQAKPEQLQRK